MVGSWRDDVLTDAPRRHGGVGRGAGREISTWAAARLRPDQVDLLGSLPHPVTLELDGFGPVLFCHGSPRDLDEVVLVDTRMSRWAEAFADLPAEVRTVVCGHTHMPFTRLVDRRLVVNPGSVGMPYGGAGAHWAILAEGRVTLGVSGFDVEEACRAVTAASGYPDVARWVADYLPSTASDVEALAVFGPRDGRDADG